MASITSLLDQIERELAPQSEHDVQEEPLFHYTNTSGFQGIVSSKSIWATDYRYLNDTEEFVIGERIVQELAEELRAPMAESPQRWLLENFATFHQAMRLTQMTNIFVASFSQEGNLLSQWRAYGARGAGYSIGFSTLPAPKTENSAGGPRALVSSMRVRREQVSRRRSVTATLPRKCVSALRRSLWSYR
jgi:hypothetical protein